MRNRIMSAPSEQSRHGAPAGAPAGRPPLPAYRWVVLLITCLVCIMGNYMQYQVAGLAVRIMPDLGLDQAGFANLMLLPMLTSVILSIPMGSLADKVGAKKVVSVCLAIAVAAGFLRAFTEHSYPLQMISMFLLGCGICAVNANLIKIFAAWFMDRTSIAMGWFFAAGGLGAILAQTISPRMPSVYTAYMSAAVILAVVWVCWLLFVHDLPQGAPQPPRGDSPMNYFAVAAKVPSVWMVGLAYGFSFAAVTAFAGFVPQALINGVGMDPVTAGSIAAAAALGSMLGSLIGPAICSRLRTWKLFLLLTFVGGAAFMVYFWAGVILPGVAPAVPVLFGAMLLSGAVGALNGPIIQGMPLAMPEIRQKYAGSAGGLVSTIGLLCSYLIPIVVSKIAGGSYVLNLGIESGVFLLGVVFLLVIPEYGPASKKAAEVRALNARDTAAMGAPAGAPVGR